MTNPDYSLIFALLGVTFVAGFFTGVIVNNPPGEDITTVQYYQQSLDYLEEIRENASK